MPVLDDADPNAVCCVPANSIKVVFVTTQAHQSQCTEGFRGHYSPRSGMYYGEQIFLIIFFLLVS